MDDLRRSLAPITSAAWAEIDAEAKRTLELTLAGRKVVDFTGPLGWDTAAVGTGRVDPLAQGPGDGVAAAVRRAQPLVELRVPFALSLAELDAISRGARDPDLEPVVQAARSMALAEDRAIFHGYPAGGIIGLCEAATASTVSLTEDYEAYPAAVAEALSTLRTGGIDGPSAIALGPRCWMGLTRTTGRGGYPIIEHVRKLVDGPIIWAPAVQGAVVASLRGGDFELVVGRDLSIGYRGHTAETVDLYIEESVTFRVHTVEAAVPLAYR